MPLIDVDAKLTKNGTEVEVKLRRVAKSTSKSAGKGGGGRGSAPRAILPKYPKVKEEGWWLILGDRNNRELLSLKRLGFGHTASAKLAVDRSANATFEPDLFVYLISDCYVGLDQEIEVSIPGSDRGTVAALGNDQTDETEGFWLSAEEVAARLSKRAAEKDSDSDEDFWEMPAAAAPEGERYSVVMAAEMPVEEDPFFWENERQYLDAK
jgi:activating signal cointegrator complex subunit 3